MQVGKRVLPVWSIKQPMRMFLALLALLYASLSAAQDVGWSVSELVTVPRTDFPVTGAPPFPCLSEKEAARLKQDPVHRFQAWFTRWLDDTFDIVTRLQRYDNCATVCAALPLGAQVIFDVRGYARVLPDGPFEGGGVWPQAPGDAGWDEAFDISLAENQRLICSRLHGHSYTYDVQGYFIVYYGR